MKEIQPFEKVIVSGDKKGFYKFLRHCPKNHLGHKFKTCEVLISSSEDFSVSRVGTFPLKVVKRP